MTALFDAAKVTVNYSLYATICYDIQQHQLPVSKSFRLMNGQFESETRGAKSPCCSITASIMYSMQLKVTVKRRSVNYSLHDDIVEILQVSC